MRKKNKERTHLHNIYIEGTVDKTKTFTGNDITRPCYKCKDRVLGCHATCERYKQSKGEK